MESKIVRFLIDMVCAVITGMMTVAATVVTWIAVAAYALEHIHLYHGSLVRYVFEYWWGK